MATTIAALSVSLTARTKKFRKGMRGATKILKQFAIAATAAGVAGVIKLGRAIEEFDRSMLQSIAIMGDLRDALRTTMRQTAIDVARVTVFSANEAAKAYFFLASAGLSAKQSIAALPFVAKFAQAGMFDMALATDLLTDAQSALGLTVKDVAVNMTNMRRVADTLVKANTLANASVQQFSEALTNKAGASLKILNKDIEEGVAVLAAFADQGIKSSEAGTALGIILRDLSTKAIKFKNKFDRANIAVFDSTGNMRNLADIIGDVENALAGLNDIQAKATLLQLGFSDKSVIFIQTLIGMSERIREYEKELRKAGGTTEHVANKQMTPMQEAMADLGASFIEAGENLQPFIVALAGSIKWFVRFSKKVHEFIAFQDLFRRPSAGINLLGLPLNDAAGNPTNLGAKDLARMVEIQERFNQLTKDGAFIYTDAANAAGILSEELNSVNDSLNDGNFVFSEASAAVDDFAETIERLQRNLRDVGATADQLAKRRILAAFEKTGGLGDPKSVDAAFRLIDSITAAEKEMSNFNKSQRDGIKLFERVRNPFEIHNDNLREYTKLLKDGFINQETFNRAVGLSQDLLNKATANRISRARSAEFQQISLSRFSVGGLRGGASKPQKIVSSQIATTNVLLEKVVMNTAGPTVGVLGA